MNIKASLIMPAYKRIDQTLKSLKLIFSSEGLGKEFDLEIIVADCSPDDTLEKTLENEFKDKIIYTRPETVGIATNKNQGAKVASHEILIFADSDIEVEKNTIFNTLKALQSTKTAAAIAGTVVWRGSDKDGQIDTPHPSDRKLSLDKTTYLEAIYSRFSSTYKSVFWQVGGYDDKAFNMRGEGADLSIRYWQAGYPLVYDPTLRVSHRYDASESAATRKKNVEWDLAKDYLLLGYKFDTLDDRNNNFLHTISSYYKQFGDAGYYKIIQGVGKNLNLITNVKSYLDQQKKSMHKIYDFKFLEVFSDRSLLNQCLANSEKLLKKVKNE